MNRNSAGLEEAITHTQAIAAAVVTCAATIGDRLVGFDAQGKIALEEFVGHVGKAWPERVPIWTITRRLPRNAAKADRVELIPLAIFVIARVHKVGTI